MHQKIVLLMVKDDDWAYLKWIENILFRKLKKHFLVIPQRKKPLKLESVVPYGLANTKTSKYFGP